jgi:hypothetical protein
MVSGVFNKSRVGNVGKLVLVFSILCAQLLPIHQAAHAAGETSSIYKIPKSSKANEYINMKVPFKANVGEQLLLNWQTLPNSNITNKNQAFGGNCNLTSSDGKTVKFLDGVYGGVKSEMEFNSANTPHIFFVATSTNLVLNCKLSTPLSEGNLKVSKYSLSSNDIYSLPEDGLTDLKTGELVVLKFQAKAGNRLSFTVDSLDLGVCQIYSISDSANSNPKPESWDSPNWSGFIGGRHLDSKIRPQLLSFTPITNGTYSISCQLDADYFSYPKSRYMRIDLKEGNLKLLRPQALETVSTPPAKCPVAKSPSAAPKISVAPNGLWIEYNEPGFSNLDGCIDGFRVYAQTLNPYTKEVVQQNGTYSIQMKDCEKREKGLIVCLIPNEEPWLQTLNSQDASSKALAVNAVAVNSKGESKASQYSFLFEKESALISAACISMQTSFANNMLIKTPIAFAIGAGVGITAGVIVSVITGGVATPFVVAAGTSIVAASIAKPVSARISASIDKKAAKKFVETYPVTALVLLISMKKSSNPDVRAKSETIQKAIQASDLMKIYQPLIGENNSLSDIEVAKILGDEKLSRIKEQEVSKFEKNGAKDVKTLFAKNPKIKVNLTKSVSKVSQGVDVYMSISEQNQNNQSAVELVLPNNCNF